MTEPASAIGFGLVFLGVSILASLFLCLTFLGLRPRLAALGAYAERAAAALAILLPPVVGLVIASALVLRSFLGRPLGLVDHCLEHPHHLHLCVYHGAGWAEQAWAVAVIAGAGAALALGLSRRLRRSLGARRALRRLEQLAEALQGHGVPVKIAPAESIFCFTAGVFEPRVFISSAAWDKLDLDERRAVIEHERAHVAHRDVWHRAVLGAFALLGAPLLSGRVLGAWSHATECACDQRSARAVGEPALVASALVKLARASGPPRIALTASFPSGDVTERVERVLEERPDGRTAAARIGLLVLVLVAAAMLASALLVDPLHHVVETVLGMS